MIEAETFHSDLSTPEPVSADKGTFKTWEEFWGWLSDAGIAGGYDVVIKTDGVTCLDTRKIRKLRN